MVIADRSCNDEGCLRVSSTVIEQIQGVPSCAPDIPTGDAWFGRIVPGSDTSSNAVAHVSNVEYVRWLDEVGQRHLANLGWNSDDLLAAGGMWFVARHEIDYMLEAYANEELHVATWVRSLRRVKSWRDTIVWRGGDDGPSIVSTASTLWVHVDLGSRRPIAPPPDMANRLHAVASGVTPTWRVRI